MPTTASRPSRATLGLAAAVALSLVAGPALAGDKPGSKAPPSKPVAATAGSYAALLADFAKRDADAKRTARQERYQAVAAYVKARGTAPDVEPAREALVDLAEEMGDSRLVVQHADEFLAAHPASESKMSVTLQRAAALADSGRVDEADKAYQAMADAVKEDNLNSFLSLTIERAQMLADVGRVDEAKAAVKKLKEDHPQTAEHADNYLITLETIGTDPEPFPDEVKDLDGKPVALGDYAGKVLLIDFWATWCGPCVREIPHVVEAYDRWHDKGFEVLGVTLDRGPAAPAKVRMFAAQNRMPWRQQHEPGAVQNTLAEKYGVEGIPHTVLVGRDGKILRVGLRGRALGHTLARVLATEKAATK